MREEGPGARAQANRIGQCRTPIGPQVWRRRNLWRWGERWFDSDEAYFLVTLDAIHSVQPGALCPVEQRVIREYLWWSLPELEAAADTCFAPRSIARHLAAPIREGIPTEIVNIQD